MKYSFYEIWKHFEQFSQTKYKHHLFICLLNMSLVIETRLNKKHHLKIASKIWSMNTRPTGCFYSCCLEILDACMLYCCMPLHPKKKFVLVLTLFGSDIIEATIALNPLDACNRANFYNILETLILNTLYFKFLTLNILYHKFLIYFI